jgi:hypothetical protein
MHPLNGSGAVMDRSSQPVVSQFQDRNTAFSRSRATSEVFGPPVPNPQAPSASQNPLGSRHELGQVRRATSAYGDAMVQRFDINRQPDKRISLIPEFLRPLSAPVPESPESLSQWLPPRRELPFPKARAAPKSRTPTIDLPPSQPKSTAHKPRTCEVAGHVVPEITTPVLNQTGKRVAQRQNNELPLATQAAMPESLAQEPPEIEERTMRQQIMSEREEEPSPLAAKSAAVTRPSTAPGLRSKATDTVIRKRPSEMEPEFIPASKQARGMADRATQTQTLSGRDHTVPLTLATDIQRSQSTAITDGIQQPPETFMNDIEAFISRYKHRPPPKEIWQRPGYSGASAEERQAIINDFICENLENEDFLKLCEDVGDVWRRVGLDI